MKEKTKIFTFGKIAYKGSGGKINLLEVQVGLYENKSIKNGVISCDGFHLSVIGGIYNAHQSGYLICGQCLDELKKYLEGDKLFQMIYDLWCKYHLRHIDKIPTEDMDKINSLFDDTYEKYFD